jgi:hypothetical protein
MYTAAQWRSERHSSVMGSHAAYEGLLSQVQGHRGCRYVIERVGMLFEPRYLTMTSNEISNFGTGREIVNTEKVRTLRTSTLLAGKVRKVHDDFYGVDRKDAGVDYVVTFRLSVPPGCQRYIDRTIDRLGNGAQGFHGTQPYLGMREYPARVDLIEDLRRLSYPDIATEVHPDGLRTVSHNADMGIVFFGTDWDNPARPNYFAPMRITRGIAMFPAWPEVRRFAIMREASA